MRTIAVVMLLLAGCGDGEFERQQMIAENNARIARACTPEDEAEQRIAQWTYDKNGDQVLLVTVRRSWGLQGNVARYMVISEKEVR